MKDQILELRAKGYTYNQIVAELGCSKGTVAYHCGAGQKEKSRIRVSSNRKKNFLKTRYLRWLEYKPAASPTGIKNSERAAYHKARDFQKDLDHIMRVPADNQFRFDDVLENLDGNSVCYLTGKPIDLSDTASYEFDHIKPRHAGGTNDLDNLGLCTKDANRAKAHLEIEELLQLCYDILLNYGIIEEVNKKEVRNE